jgi:hypothetical protein
MKKLENIITIVFHRNYRGDWIQWIQEYEDAFTDFIFWKKTWNDDDIKKRQSVQNAQNTRMVDTVFVELVSDKSFIETCTFLRSHAIIHDQQIRKGTQYRYIIHINLLVRCYQER